MKELLLPKNESEEKKFLHEFYCLYLPQYYYSLE